MNQVHAGSKVLSVHGVISSGVKMELEHIIWDRLSWDHHTWDSAAISVRFVTGKDGVVVDGEVNVIKGTRSSLEDVVNRTEQHRESKVSKDIGKMC